MEFFFSRKFVMALATVLAVVFVQLFPEFQERETEISAAIVSFMTIVATILYSRGYI